MDLSFSGRTTEEGGAALRMRGSNGVHYALDLESVADAGVRTACSAGSQSRGCLDHRDPPGRVHANDARRPDLVDDVQYTGNRWRTQWPSGSAVPVDLSGWALEQGRVMVGTWCQRGACVSRTIHCVNQYHRAQGACGLGCVGDPALAVGRCGFRGRAPALGGVEKSDPLWPDIVGRMT